VLFVNALQGYPHRIGQDDTLAHFRTAEVVNLADAGHWAHHDQLDAFMGAVERFLAN
jgi:pimeloyl-ACP methyl ester carboxylesterase